MIILFVSKFLEGLLGTLKSIFLNKNKNILSAILKTLSTLFQFVAIGVMIADPSMTTILVICVATFLGAYLPSLCFNRKVVVA